MATMQKYRDYVITSFTKAVQPIVVEKAHGAVIMDAMDKEYLDALPESPFVGHSSRCPYQKPRPHSNS